MENNETPSIYVACLSSYNEGVLHGCWIDATQGYDDIESKIRDMLSKSPCDGIAEEWAIHDYENFCGLEFSEYIGIDEIIKRIVSKKMVSVSNKKELLLNKMQPLSSFSAKIEFCFRLGVISETLKDDLNALRKMRNKYAHDLNDISLEDPEMSEIINKILAKCPMIEHNSKNGSPEPTNRKRIEGFVGAVLITLNNMVLKLEEVKTAEKEKFIYESIKN